MDFLKDHKYYSDLYNEKIVEDLMYYEAKFLDDPDARKNIRAVDGILNLLKHFYLEDKSKVIKDWRDKDRERERLYNETAIPKIHCKLCESEMEFLEKHISYAETKKGKDRLCHIFICKECKVLREVYSDGSIVDVIPWKCPRCTRKMNKDVKGYGRKYSVSKSCPFCGFTDSYEIDLDEKICSIPELSREEKIKINIFKDRFGIE